MRIESQFHNYEHNAIKGINPQHENMKNKHAEIREDSPPENTKDSTLAQIEKIEKLSASIQEYMHSMDVKLEFHVDRDAEQIQVKVIDPEKDEVIRKIPPDEVLELAKSIENMLGIIMNRNL
ncbi:MAG: flagellar protein FlaG [Thermodesulfobacteriota bacterium]